MTDLTDFVFRRWNLIRINGSLHLLYHLGITPETVAASQDELRQGMAERAGLDQ